MNKIIRMPLVRTKQKSEPSPRARKRPIQDLREWLSHVERIGELVRVAEPVDRDEEMSGISYLVAKQKSSPASGPCAKSCSCAGGQMFGVRLLQDAHAELENGALPRSYEDTIKRMRQSYRTLPANVMHIHLSALAYNFKLIPAHNVD
jgi:hypothetical protein